MINNASDTNSDGWSDGRTEYGGYAGDNRRTPDGRPRRLSNAEMAADMRRAGIRNEPLPSILGSYINGTTPPDDDQTYSTRIAR